MWKNKLTAIYLSKLHGGESGAILVLSAILALTLFLIIIAIGVDTTLVKHLRQELEQKVESACHEASYLLPMQGEAADFFEGRISNFDLRFGELADWQIYVPTASVNEAGTYAAPPDVCEPFQSFLPPFDPPETQENYTVDLSTLCPAEGPPRFNLGSDSDDPAAFPPTFWNSPQYFGNAIGCEARAEYQPFWVFDDNPESRRSVVVRSIWWRPLAGADFDYSQAVADVPNPSSPPDPPPPALSIVVAPHMTTRFDDERFRFTDNPDPDLNLNQYNPFKPDTSQPAINSFTSLAEGSSPTFRSYFDPPGEIQMAGHPALTDEQARELATACYNPAVLVRNTLVATIAKFAARHAHAVNHTEILLAGTRDYQTGLDFEDLWLRDPIRLVDFGADLSIVNPLQFIGVQIPYLFFYRGDASSGGDGRWVYPLAHDGDDAGRTPAQLRLDFMQSAQLRVCMKGYTLNGDPIQYWPHFSGSQLDFEPPRYGDPFPPFSDEPVVEWEQHCPFGEGTCAGEASIASTLSPVQALSSLGTVQICPHDVAGVCTKPNPDADLEPDIFRTVQYLLDNNDAPAFVSPAMGPLREPGGSESLESILETYDFEDNFPLSSDGIERLRSPYPRSTVLLVLHKPLVEEEERNAIRTVIDGSPARRWVVIYIPTNSSDAQQYGTITEAFNMVVDPESDQEILPDTNLFFMFQPYLLDENGDINDSEWSGEGPMPGSEELVFRQYWEDLLLGTWGDNPDDVVDRARKIWNLAFMFSTRKL